MQNKFDKGWCLFVGGLRFILALRIALPIIVKTLLNKTDKYSGTWLLIALYTMPKISCCIVS